MWFMPTTFIFYKQSAHQKQNKTLHCKKRCRNPADMETKTQQWHETANFMPDWESDKTPIVISHPQTLWESDTHAKNCMRPRPKASVSVTTVQKHPSWTKKNNVCERAKIGVSRNHYGTFLLGPTLHGPTAGGIPIILLGRPLALGPTFLPGSDSSSDNSSSDSFSFWVALLPAWMASVAS